MTKLPEITNCGDLAKSYYFFFKKKFNLQMERKFNNKTQHRSRKDMLMG